MTQSRSKGKRGELELAAYLRERGIEARRGQQFSGGAGSPDVVHNIPGVHLECKRCEAGNLYDWLAQARRDAGTTQIPVVAHRKNNREWVAILPLSALLTLLSGASSPHMEKGSVVLASDPEGGTLTTKSLGPETPMPRSSR